MRAAIAFAVAPAVGVVATWLALVAFMWPLSLGLVVSMLWIAYLVTVVVGVPAFLWFRSWALLSFWSYALAGLIVASIAAVPIWLLLGSLALGLVAIMTGVITGLTFGLILGPKSNNRWRGP
jgi:hypothetical protein